MFLAVQWTNPRLLISASLVSYFVKWLRTSILSFFVSSSSCTSISSPMFRWGSKTSSSFSIKNGVGQGKILAGFSYCYYCFELSVLLENSGFGCKINDIFSGAFGFSDNNIFLAPSISSLQEMLKIAESFCKSHGLKFSNDPNKRKSNNICIAWMKHPSSVGHPFHGLIGLFTLETQPLTNKTHKRGIWKWKIKIVCLGKWR